MSTNPYFQHNCRLPPEPFESQDEILEAPVVICVLCDKTLGHIQNLPSDKALLLCDITPKTIGSIADTM